MAKQRQSKKQVKHVAKYQKNPRMERFIQNLILGKPVSQAAIEAGYSESYSNSLIYHQMKTSPNFKRLVEEYSQRSVELVQLLYKANLLPRTYKIDSKILDTLEEDPRLAVRHAKPTVDRVHRIAGTLGPEQPVQQPTVNIAEVRNLMIQVCNDAPGRKPKIAAPPEEKND